MNPYCAYCLSHPQDTLNRVYHDTQYGFALEDDNLLFERLILEINQAGLSWTTILKKAENFRRAYDNFDIEKVAAYEENERARLLADAGIIRNRLKVNAAIENARRIRQIQREHGSFKAWLDAQRGQDKAAWVKSFKQKFVFTGGEIVGEFLLSTGYLPGAHSQDCPIYERTTHSQR
ncbi:MAG: DNA-3-methyladenine glycosylase I [Anaerolineales bacterium]